MKKLRSMLLLKPPTEKFFLSVWAGSGLASPVPNTLILAFENILNTFDGISASDRTLCWLPMASLFQRIINLCAFVPGVPTYFVSPQELGLGLLETRPTLMITSKFVKFFTGHFLYQLKTER